jgi:hypothetical protein
MNIPTLDQLKRALHISETIERLQGELSSLFGRAGAKMLGVAESGMRMATRGIDSIEVTRKKPRFSQAARARIAAAQKKRWAKVKDTKSKPAAAKEKPKAGRKKGKMSAAGRAAIVAAQKKRWAAVKREKSKAASPKAKKRAGKSAPVAPTASSAV